MIRNLAVAMGAVGASAFSFAISFPLDPWPLIWFPSGVALAAILAWGWRALPAVFVGTALAVAVEMIRFSPSWEWMDLIIVVGGSALGTVLGPWATGAWILRKPEWREDLLADGGALRFFLATSLPVGIVGVLPWGLAWQVGIVANRVRGGIL